MFSVLLSTFYRENPFFLRQSLNSIFTQTLPPDEVVLVEDGPLTGELCAVVKEYTQRYPILKVVSLPKNVGLGQALNEGLKHCSYELVARMDTDDVSKPDRFEKQIAVFQAHPEVDVVGAWIDEFEGDTGNVLSVRKLPETHWKILKYARFRCPANHPVTVFRKSAVLNAGGYLHFPLFEDYYLWVRMLIAGACFYNVQESLLWFRFSPEMFKRRGGWKYACDEYRLQKKMLNMDFISLSQFIQNVSLRFISRIIPNQLRVELYKRFLR